MILCVWYLHPHLEDDWFEGYSSQEDNSFDDHCYESSSNQICVTDGEKVLQDICSELVVKEASHSKLEDNDCDSSDSLSTDCSASFAVTITNTFS